MRSLAVAEDLASVPSAEPMTSIMRPGFGSILTRPNGLMPRWSTWSSWRAALRVTGLELAWRTRTSAVRVST